MDMLLGDYAMRTPTETLMAKTRNGASNDLARLKGARFVYASEAEEGRRLAESLIKDVTGGDKVTARFLYAEHFEFRPTSKLWLATNHRPIIKGTDDAIWARIRLIPFGVSIPEAERIPLRQLLARFDDELPGILNWAIQGCLEWQRSGLGAPEPIRQATESYRSEMDVLGQFLREQVVIDRRTLTFSSDLYRDYMIWCEESGERPISQRAFGQALTERGFERGKKDHLVAYLGIRLRRESDRDSEMTDTAMHDAKGSHATLATSGGARS
jgi:putative DNA primase/helicase